MKRGRPRKSSLGQIPSVVNHVNSSCATTSKSPAKKARGRPVGSRKKQKQVVPFSYSRGESGKFWCYSFKKSLSIRLFSHPSGEKEDFGSGPFENPSSFGISSTQVVNPADSSASPSENPATKACGRPLGAGTKQHLETLGFLVKISTVVDVVSHLFNFPEAIERLGILSRSNENSENKGNILVDTPDTPKEYIFHMDVPSLSKSTFWYQQVDHNYEYEKHELDDRETDHGHMRNLQQHVSYGYGTLGCEINKLLQHCHSRLFASSE
ncbi:hypothetical protein CQW23_18943 [Capsicum baccatum]|uniref:Uncharacterized protein n=1 Tax=Capsicum baccatum TaxID=33114 RepID=A0A2G2W4H0_CAPBA|nr:hypothetical protein CQW23_18943 [Capsicum baccatum]